MGWNNPQNYRVTHNDPRQKANDTHTGSEESVWKCGRSVESLSFLLHEYLMLWKWERRLCDEEGQFVSSGRKSARPHGRADDRVSVRRGFRVAVSICVSSCDLLTGLSLSIHVFNQICMIAIITADCKCPETHAIHTVRAISAFKQMSLLNISFFSPKRKGLLRSKDQIILTMISLFWGM